MYVTNHSIVIYRGDQLFKGYQEMEYSCVLLRVYSTAVLYFITGGPNIVAVGEFCMPTNECRKGGGLLATDSYPTISQSIIMQIWYIFRQANFACQSLYSSVHQGKGLIVLQAL